KLLDLAKNENNTFVLNFQLSPEGTNLEEIVIEAGEDPSYPIMRQVIKNKKFNDKRRLPQFEYESYVKIEIDIDNTTGRFAKRKIVQKVQQAIDTLGGLTGEDGEPLIPLFLSETISKFYYRNNPERVKEEVIKNKIEGVGLGPNTPLNQILGSSFQEYNFYKNWMKVLEKDFVSPLADGWRLYYEYYLADSMMIDGRFCYKIEVYPKSEQDLSFEGLIWIDKETHALKQIDVKVGKAANVNFVEKIKIQQAYQPTEKGPWIPIKTRVLIDIAEISENSAGLIAKFYVSNKDIELDTPHKLNFFKEPLVIDSESKISDAEYWEKKRHDPLSESELRTYELIDTIKQIPVVRTYSSIINVLSSGYYTLGPIDFGNYLFTYASNDLEGLRFRLGLRTNTSFSRKVEFKGYLAYGT
ncbi:MAG: DUF5686 family protein, partial [Bacteroidota bacterium]